MSCKLASIAVWLVGFAGAVDVQTQMRRVRETQVIDELGNLKVFPGKKDAHKKQDELPDAESMAELLQMLKEERQARIDLQNKFDDLASRFQNMQGKNIMGEGEVDKDDEDTQVQPENVMDGGEADEDDHGAQKQLFRKQKKKKTEGNVGVASKHTVGPTCDAKKASLEAAASGPACGPNHLVYGSVDGAKNINWDGAIAATGPRNENSPWAFRRYCCYRTCQTWWESTWRSNSCNAGQGLVENLGAVPSAPKTNGQNRGGAAGTWDEFENPSVSLCCRTCSDEGLVTSCVGSKCLCVAGPGPAPARGSPSAVEASLGYSHKA